MYILKDGAALKPKVVISYGFRNEVIEEFKRRLSDIAEVIPLPEWMSSESLREIRNAEVLVPLHEFVGEALLEHAPRLKAVSRFGVGYERIDVEACTRRGVYVTHTPGILSHAVAELTLALMLCLSRRMMEADRYVRTKWAMDGRTTIPLGNDLQGKTLGIIGLGRIGIEVARRAKAFNMQVIYYDKMRRLEAEENLGVRYVSLKHLLETSDFVSLHVPLTPETRHLIGERELRMMKKTAYLINTSRGAVVDEKALCRALREGWIAGAGLDVFYEEPVPLDNPLLKMENVVLTPHMATHTVETRQLMVAAVTEDIRRVLSGKPPLNLVPEQREKRFHIKS